MSKLTSLALVRPSLSLSDSELDCIAELLQVAQTTLLNLADAHQRYTGHTLVAEQLRVSAESAADIIERIEQR